MFLRLSLSTHNDLAKWPTSNKTANLKYATSSKLRVIIVAELSCKVPLTEKKWFDKMSIYLCCCRYVDSGLKQHILDFFKFIQSLFLRPEQVHVKLL